ncbi:MAG TPA: hypothetical protein VN493_17780 [Thermoanaerobaculia bacterium]|nr:hypothetical protein [Thermoanaerobaculia bacterium]
MSLPAERGPQQPRAVREVLQATLFPDYGQTEPSVGFLARAFIVATLPHSRPTGNEFTQRNDYYRLALLATLIRNQQVIGSIPIVGSILTSFFPTLARRYTAGGGGV